MKESITMPESPESSSVQTAEQADERFDAILDEAPAEPTAPAEPAEPEAVEAPEPETSEGPPRDEKGRFAKADQPEAAPSEAPSPDAPTEPTTEGEAEVAYPAFRYRADGQEHELPGSAVGEHGVFLPNEMVPQITRLLQEGHAHRGSFQRLLSEKAREIQNAAAERDAAKAELTEIKAKIEELVRDENAFDRFVQDQRGNWEITKAKAEAAAHRTLLERERSQREEYERERQEQQLRPLMRDRLAGALNAVGKELQLPPTVLETAWRRMNQDDYVDRLFPRAQEDDPINNVRKGQRYDVQLQVVWNELQAYADIMRTVGPPTQPTPPKPKAPVKPIQKPPPTVSTKGGQAPSGPKRPDFSKEKDPTAAVDDWFDKDGFLEG